MKVTEKERVNQSIFSKYGMLVIDPSIYRPTYHQMDEKLRIQTLLESCNSFNNELGQIGIE